MTFSPDRVRTPIILVFLLLSAAILSICLKSSSIGTSIDKPEIINKEYKVLCVQFVPGPIGERVNVVYVDENGFIDLTTLSTGANDKIIYSNTTKLIKVHSSSILEYSKWELYWNGKVECCEERVSV